jgi:L-alanine-DL-glutamate epimerase-like enolase superfamily enzyme
MKITSEPYTVKLKSTWRIAHGASDQRYNVFVNIGDGWGEAAGVPYFNETQEGILAYLEQIGERAWDPFNLEEPLINLPHGSAAARCAIDLALHDWLGKELGQPLYRLLGVDMDRAPETTYSIPIDKPEVMAEKARQSGMPKLKIKLGGGEDDLLAVRLIRETTPASIRVDANAGWSRAQAKALIPQLKEFDIEYVEQPLAIGDIEGLRWLHDQKLGVPIFADENVKTSHDVAAHVGAVDGVVIKLAKTGGIREALRAIHTARAFDLQVMIGCMVETSLAVAAAANLAPLCDYADIDSPLLVANDPFEGLAYDGAKVRLSGWPGLGVRRKA